MSRVTAVVLNYNYGRFLGECLSSIDAQTYRDVHVIVIDDASTDDSLDVINTWVQSTSLSHEVVAKPENRGPAHSYNMAFKMLDSDYVAFIDADDRWLRDKFERQVAQLDAAADDVVVLYSDIRTFGDGRETVRKPAVPVPAGPLVEYLLAANSTHAVHSALVRTTAVKRIVPLSERLRLCDTDLWLKLARLGRFVYVPFDAGEYRLHGGSMSATDRSLSDVLAIVATHCTTGGERAAARKRGRRVAITAVMAGLRPRARDVFAYAKAARDPVVLGITAWPRASAFALSLRRRIRSSALG